jgi:hypothetical protein
LRDVPAWLGLLVAAAALVFSGLQLQMARDQSSQTEKALRASTAAVIYQEDREVWKAVTPDIYEYFDGADAPSREDKGARARKARIVAGAMLDHFEHVRFQIANDTMAADKQSRDSYIVDTFRNSPLLCQQFQDKTSFYGGGGAGTIGDWAAQGCKN